MTSLISKAWRVLYNAVLDLRYGRPLAGQVPTRFAHLGAKDTANSDYLALDKIFAGRIEPEDVLVDVGCGKGRVLNWWLRHYDNQIVGVEIDPEIAAATRRRLRKHARVRVVAGNVVECLPEDGALFYLFNPFFPELMRAFADRLGQLGRERGGRIRLVYNNCKYLEPFTDVPHWSVVVLDAAITAPYDRVAIIDYRPDVT